MKSSTAIICLIVCLSVFSSVQGKSKSHALLRSWDEASITVMGKSNYKFACKVKEVDQANNKSLGMMFDGFEQLSDQDRSGFMQYVVKLTKIQHLDLNLPVLDYRFVQNCAFTDNSNEMFGAWRLSFDVSGNEEYGIQENPTLGDTWKISMTLPEANRKQATGLKARLTENCKNRNIEVTQLKADAIKAGSEYFSLHSQYLNRQQTLDQLVALGAAAATVIDEVKAAESAQKDVIDKSIADNEAELKKSADALNAIAAAKQDTEEEAEQFSEKLSQIKSDLSLLLVSQSLVKRTIVQSSQQLTQAIDLKNNQTQAKDSLDTKAKLTAQQAEDDKKEFERVMKEIAEQQKAAQEANKKAVEAQKAALALINAQVTAVSSDIESSNKAIVALKQSIQIKSEQVKSIDNQAVQIRVSIQMLQDQIDKKRSVAKNFNAQIKLQEQEIKNQAAEAAKIAAQNQKELEMLQAKELKSINLLTNLTAEAKAKEIYMAEQAQKDVASASGNFTAACQAIVNSAAITHIRTSNALKNVLANGHVSEITAIVSHSVAAMKFTLIRLAKYNKQQVRLAKIRNQQMSQVRFQRTKLRNSIKNKLRTHKKHLKQ